MVGATLASVAIGTSVLTKTVHAAAAVTTLPLTTLVASDQAGIQTPIGLTEDPAGDLFIADGGGFVSVLPGAYTTSPFGVSVVAGKPTTLATGAAKFAIDNQPVQNNGNSHIAATLAQTNPWWQVDLGTQHSLSEIDVDNRSDCCVSRPTNYWVFVSNTPFDTTLSAQAQQNAPGVTYSANKPDQASPVTRIMLPAGVTGR